jgi:chromosome segregation ATPase
MNQDTISQIEMTVADWLLMKLQEAHLSINIYKSEYHKATQECDKYIRAIKVAEDDIIRLKKDVRTLNDLIGDEKKINDHLTWELKKAQRQLKVKPQTKGKSDGFRKDKNHD